MAEVKITDLVPQETIDKVKELDTEIKGLLGTYVQTAKDMAKGLEINVKVVGDIDKIYDLYNKGTREATETAQRLNVAMDEQRQIIANTTNTIQRKLMEQERLNKAVREEYRDGEKVKSLIEETVNSYKGQTIEMAKLEQQIKKNKESQKTLEEQYKKGMISQDAYIEKSAELIAKGRELALSKSQLGQLMKIEEKLNSDNAGSYNQLSHQLELLKKTYKDMSDTQKQTDIGKQFERSIQDLDAHLKDLAADMGEFQRNVGNYAIAGQNGVVSIESLMVALNQQAVTIKDVSDQSKLLTEARAMLDTNDVRYAETVEAINARLAENSKRLSDVSDIMGVHATTAAEAEEQNKRLREALKQVDQTSEDAASVMAELTAKIDENDKVIEAGSGQKQTLKKDLKELVLEIANLTIEYQNLSAEEQASAEGQALASHIQELTERAGELKDVIADTNAAITNAASDTRGLDQLGGALQLAIDGFGLATGAAEMLGISQGELEEVQTKLQAAIAASNAMQSIQNTLQKQSAVMQGAAAVQTRLRTIAEQLHTAAQGRGVIATKALTAAQWGFNAAANANPVGLLIVGITALVALIWGLTKAFKAFFDPSEEAVQKCKSMKESIDEMSDAYDRNTERMKARGATEAEMLDRSIKHHEKYRDAVNEYFENIAKYYKEDSDEYKEALEAKQKADEDYEKSLEDGYVFLLKLQQQTNAKIREQEIGTLAYKLEIIEKEKEEQLKLAETLLANGKLTRQMYEDIVATVNKSAEIKIKETKETEERKTTKLTGKNPVDEAKKQAEELKKAVQAGEDALISIIADSLERQKAMEDLAYQRKLKDLQEQLAKTKSTQIELRLSINRQIEALEVEHQRKLLEIQDAQSERRINAESQFIATHLSIVKEGTKEELDWKLKQLEVEMSRELFDLAKAEHEKTVTVEQGEEIRANIIEKYAQMAEKANEEYADARAQQIQDRYSVEQIIAENSLVQQINAAKSKYAEDLALAKDNQKKKKEAEKTYQREMERLQMEYARSTVEREIEMMEKMLEVSGLSAEERLKIEQELTAKRRELQGIIDDMRIRSLENEAKDGEDWDNDWKERVQKWLNVASDAANKISDLIDAVYDKKIEKLDAEIEANTAAGEEEQARISELVEKKVITEEEGEARKRAAEAQTAKRNEELEKKKAALQHKAAVYQKANDLAQAGIATALAITQALPNLVLAAIAGSMGALQIATILATPIPQYAKGTDYHQGGMAIVGDGGRSEVVLFNGGAWLTPDTPTLVDIPQGAKVLPDINAIDESIFNLVTPVNNIPEAQPVVVNNDYSKLEREIKNVGDLIRQQTKVQRKIALDQQYEQFKRGI